MLFRERRMRREGVLHFIRARLEYLEQIAVSALEILEDFGELAHRCCGIERQDAIDDVVRAGLVGDVEVARFGCRLERAHEHPGRIGT